LTTPENYGEDPRTLDRRSTPSYQTHPDSELPLFPLFQIGTALVSAGAINFLIEHGISAYRLVYRHQSGDYGDLDAGDLHENAVAIASGLRILSAYQIAGERLLVITEADRSTTTVLLSSEY
jgi:hypothetical protein